MINLFLSAAFAVGFYLVLVYWLLSAIYFAVRDRTHRAHFKRINDEWDRMAHPRMPPPNRYIG